MRWTGRASGAAIMLALTLVATGGRAEPGQADHAPKPPASPAAAEALAEVQSHKTGAYTIEQRGVDPERFAMLTQRVKAKLEDGPKLKRHELARWDAERGVERWHVRVPEGYNADTPYGLIVFISPEAGGDVPEGWGTVLDERRLIWVGPVDAGNNVMIVWRMAKALEAVALAQQRYNLDKNRVYIAGFSGGGRMASVIAPNFPDYFAGGLFICGCNALDQTAVAGGRYLADARRGRYVFVTGQTDYNRDETRQVARGYRAARFASVDYLEVPDMDHALPSGAWFDKALAPLDAPFVAMAERAYQKAERYDKGGRLGMAVEPYAEAVRLGFGADFAKAAEKRHAELTDAYAEAVKAVEKQIEAGEAEAARESLLELRRSWVPLAREDMARLSRAIVELRRAEQE